MSGCNLFSSFLVVRVHDNFWRFNRRYRSRPFFLSIGHRAVFMDGSFESQSLVSLEVNISYVKSDVLDFVVQLRTPIVLKNNLMHFVESQLFKCSKLLCLFVGQNLLKCFANLWLNPHWNVLFHKVFDHGEVVAVVFSLLLELANQLVDSVSLLFEYKSLLFFMLKFYQVLWVLIKLFAVDIEGCNCKLLLTLKERNVLLAFLSSSI